LQYGDTQGQQKQLFDTYGKELVNINDVDNFNDIDGLVALISATDIVVTISNTTAHLAGAIGKKQSSYCLHPAGEYGIGNQLSKGRSGIRQYR